MTYEGHRQRSCGRCEHFTPLNPLDRTAPEGRCGLPEYPGHWPTGYWPNVLAEDGCGKFKKAVEDKWTALASAKDS